MSNTSADEHYEESTNDSPGAVLAAQRLNLGYSVDFVAEKLHLRARLIELLENDDYANMPEPVFIKGYLRAYAKLVGMKYEPLLSSFNRAYSIEKKSERALWQSRKETNKAEFVIRWFTTAFAVLVIIAVAMWWHANKDNENIFSSSLNKSTESASNVSESEIRLTDLSKMRSLLASPVSAITMETAGGE